MQSLKTEHFNLKHTVESGQIFAFKEESGGYRITERNQNFFVRQKGKALFYEGVDEKFIRHYFRLDEDHKKILRRLSGDLRLRKAIRSCSGIRLIRQDPWQCTIGFLCSQNSNITRIRNNIHTLMELFGEGGFPAPGKINDRKKLSKARLGYREPFIFETNKLVDDAFFEKLRGLSYEEAKEKLMELPGIGPKVADCILLFSLGFDHAFPVDVWIQRVIGELYFNGELKKPAEIAAFAHKHFAEYAGYAQQYLFHWRRNQE